MDAPTTVFGILYLIANEFKPSTKKLEILSVKKKARIKTITTNKTTIVDDAI